MSKRRDTNKINFQDGSGDDSTEGGAWFIILFLLFPAISFVVENIKTILIITSISFVILFCTLYMYRRSNDETKNM